MSAEELSYLQKTNDAYLYDNLSIDDLPYREIVPLDYNGLAHNSVLEKANEYLAKDGIVSIKKIMNIDELEEIRKYADRKISSTYIQKLCYLTFDIHLNTLLCLGIFSYLFYIHH